MSETLTKYSRCRFDRKWEETELAIKLRPSRGGQVFINLPKSQVKNVVSGTGFYICDLPDWLIDKEFLKGYKI